MGPLHSIFMPVPRFCMPSSLRGAQDVAMDVVAILIGIAMFAVLLAIVYGIERI